jgi:hypothetical protein
MNGLEAKEALRGDGEEMKKNRGAGLTVGY